MSVSDVLAHTASDPAERRDLERMRDFVRRHADPFDRRLEEGHLTASALVLEPQGEWILLLHHRKLKRWLQPGGHAEPGERDGSEIALREACEETGIRELRLHPRAPRPLDVDVHAIPARPGEPAHLHLDLRYLVLAAPDATTRRAVAEANDLRWFHWDDLATLELDAGLLRALDKSRRWLGHAA